MTTPPADPRLETFRTAVAAGEHTFRILDELVRALRGFPGPAQIRAVAGALAELLGDTGGDAGGDGDSAVIEGLRLAVSEVEALAAIPGDEAVVSEELCQAVPEAGGHPVLGAVEKSLWPLLDAVDDRAFPQGAALNVTRSVHAVLFGVVERAMERHASEADLHRWRTRKSGVAAAPDHGEREEAPPLRPRAVPGVNAEVTRFLFGIADRLAAAYAEGARPPEPFQRRWPMLGRETGRCCGSAERHAHGLTKERSRAVERILMRRAAQLEPGERTAGHHLFPALRGASRTSSMRLAATFVRRAAALLREQCGADVERMLEVAEAQGASADAPVLAAETYEALVSAPQPMGYDAGAFSFYWAVRGLAEASHGVGSEDDFRREIARAVTDGIDARAQARLALEEPESWNRHVEESRAALSEDRIRVEYAHLWLADRTASGVEREELQAGWTLVAQMLEEAERE